MQKKRILMCNDAHYLNSGYAKYGKEVLSRLHATGKYEIAEFARYGTIEDASVLPYKWKFYANAVKHTHKKFDQYRLNVFNEYGSWRFDRVVLDFKPDIVFDISDPWYSPFIYNSPLREFFHFCIMPPVDSIPQQDAWIDNFRTADSVMVYSDWAKPVLEANNIKVSGTASPGVDINCFRPLNIKSSDRYIIGTIMRNQSRKLYPDLFAAFKKFLDKAPENIANKTYLYIHAGYPDAGWNFPELMMEHEICHKVLYTYVCKNCKHWFSSLYRDTRTICNKCGANDCFLPSPENGLNDKDLAKVINTFDVYVQYSVAEGFGMPQLEAGACGVPIMSIDYSAMSDVVRKLGGIPLRPAAMFKDLTTQAYRAVPDNEFTANELVIFFTAQQESRENLSKLARVGTINNYTWDITTKTWENHFDSIELKDNQGKYDLPYREFPSFSGYAPDNINNNQFVDWCFNDIMGEPEHINSYKALSMKTDLQLGHKKSGKDNLMVTRQTTANESIKYAEIRQEAEKVRCGLIVLPPEDYIGYANE